MSGSEAASPAPDEALQGGECTPAGMDREAEALGAES